MNNYHSFNVVLQMSEAYEIIQIERKKFMLDTLYFKPTQVSYFSFSGASSQILVAWSKLPQ
jgi:hypothetical protein